MLDSYSFPSVQESHARSAILSHLIGSMRPEESRIRVLVVDDDIRIADTIAEVLDDAGFEARVAYTGQRALEVAGSFRPDCLLTDIVMSHMNGISLAIAFRRIQPECRIVLITGQMGLSDILEDAERQGLDFELLPKPIHPRRLISELRKTPKR